jgi:hypothetical protein
MKSKCFTRLAIAALTVAALQAPLFSQTTGKVTAALTAGDTTYTAIAEDVDGRTVSRIVKHTGGVGIEILIDISGTVHSLAFGNGELFIGGEFEIAGAGGLVIIANITGWADGALQPLGNGLEGPDGAVHALCYANGALYVGGEFDHAGPASIGEPDPCDPQPAKTRGVARWDGASWSALGSGIDGPVLALAESNGLLYAAGAFEATGSGAPGNVAVWDGSSWSAAGESLSGSIHALALDDAGLLYAAGSFDDAGGGPGGVAVFDGAAWTTLGGGFYGAGLALHAGPQGLSVAGSIAFSADGPEHYAARWDGAAWSTPVAGPASYAGELIEQDGQLMAGGDFIGLTAIGF